MFTIPVTQDTLVHIDVTVDTDDTTGITETIDNALIHKHLTTDRPSDLRVTVETTDALTGETLMITDPMLPSLLIHMAMEAQESYDAEPDSRPTDAELRQFLVDPVTAVVIIDQEHWTITVDDLTVTILRNDIDYHSIQSSDGTTGADTAKAFAPVIRALMHIDATIGDDLVGKGLSPV